MFNLVCGCFGRSMCVIALLCGSANLEASMLRFTIVDLYGDYVTTGSPGALTGTVFSLPWEKDSDPAPNASLSNQTFIGNVLGVYSTVDFEGNFPTNDFYPR